MSIEFAQVLETYRHVCMVWPERILSNCECPYVQALRIRILTEINIGPGKVAECCGNRWMVSSKYLFANRERLLQEPLAISILCLGLVQQPEIVQYHGGIDVFGTQALLIDCDCA